MSKIVKSIFNRPVHKDDIIPDLTFVQFVIYKYCIFQDKYHLGEKTFCVMASILLYRNDTMCGNDPKPNYLDLANI